MDPRNALSVKELGDSGIDIQGQGIDSPLSIEMITLPTVGEIFATSNRLREIRQIRQAAKLVICGPSDGSLLELEGDSREAV